MDNYERAVQPLRLLAIDAVAIADSGQPGTPQALSSASVSTDSALPALTKSWLGVYGLTPERVVDSILKRPA